MNKNDNLDSSTLSGHRSRLKERFLKSPNRTLPDYEILEMILFNAIPRRDTKMLAKYLLDKFGSLIAVLSADQIDLKNIPGIGRSVLLQFKLFLDTFTRLHVAIDLKDVNIINSWTAVLNYCHLTMGFKSIEHFRILFLNKKNVLIADELFETGTVDRVNIYPREIVKKALHYNSSAIILIHNHPSGDAKPSKDDIEITNSISAALSHCRISVHDHVIIAQHSHFSFRNSGLLNEENKNS